jgi:hypothetical protein
VFENRMLRRIFGLKREELTAGWRELDKVKDNNVCTSCKMIESRSMHWVGMYEGKSVNKSQTDIG